MLNCETEGSDTDKMTKPTPTRPKPDGPSAVVIRAHEQTLAHRQKNFTTKPIPVLPIRNRSTVVTQLSLPVEMPEDELPVETMPTILDSPKSPVKTKPVGTKSSYDRQTEVYVETDSEQEKDTPKNGTLTMKTIGIIKRKKYRKARCELCGASCDSIKELN